VEPERLRSALDILGGHPQRVLDRRRGSAMPADLTTLEAMLQAGHLTDADGLLAAWAGELADPGCPASRRGHLGLMLRLGRMQAALVRQRPAEVRGLALDAAGGLPGDPSVRDYVLQALVHAELGLGGTARARAQLQAIDPDRRRGALRMEWVRLLLAEGDDAGAGSLFARLVAEGPPGRVLAKVRLAHELDRVAMARLWLAAAPAPGPEPIPVPAATADPAPLIGDGPGMTAVRQRIVALAPLPQPVLLLGETGTGKEVVARLLHRHGRGAEAPFLALNCAAIPDSLAEAELFGHRRGAFTGADGDREGLLAAAGTGTVLLDEVNSMSLRLQGVLLRVLETGDFRAVGATTVRRTRARFVVAANSDLAAAVAAGTFRKDLFYRLQGFTIRLPPLRERREDLPALVRHFLRQVSGEDGLEAAPDLLEAFAAHPWPGNVRELRSVIEGLALLRGGQRRFTRRDWIADGAPGADHAPAQVTEPDAVPAATAAPIPGPPRARERRRRLLALFASHPHLYREDAVRELGIAPSTACTDLAALAAAGLVRRVLTSGHLRTSYFIRTGG
jgi:DNA-binding NtrC family response regulator